MENNIMLKDIPIPGDGACLFSSLSYLLHGTISLSTQIRKQIVNHVFANWQRFQCITQQLSGKPYDTKHLYLDDMLKPNTQGSLCEVKAASELYAYEFQVYQDGRAVATFGIPLQGVKRLKFTGNYNNGHFNALIPLIESISSDAVNLNNSNNEQELFNDQQSSDQSISSIEITPQSIHGKKRRKRFSGAIRAKQIREAASKYAKNHREVHRTAVKLYQQKHPEVNLKAVQKYRQSHSVVTKKADLNYKTKNPNYNRKAESKYHDKRLLSSLFPWTSKHGSGFEYNHQIDYSNDKIIRLGSRSSCPWCRALKWKDETKGMCCSSGKVQCPKVKPYPELLHSLLNHQHPMSEHFLCNVRKYNGCFQMTSFGAKIVNEGNFLSTFKVQGQVYHRIGSLMAGLDQKPSFLQIYFVGDDDRERDIRCGIYPGIKPELIHQLQILLHKHNKYVLDFQAAISSIPKDKKEFKVMINADLKPSGAHKGRFNAPRTKEVAVLIAGQDFEKRDIVLHSRDNKLIRISEIHRAYDALQYPLMFFHGEDGYYINIPKCDPETKAPLNTTVSASEFYSYRVMERDGENCYLLSFRNLLSQFLVDMYAKIETERLNWIRHNQKTLRSEEYVHLKDALLKNDGDLSTLGKMVVLPSSFTGGPRYMHERTQDAMTYVRHYGRPDLFITFTCNPKWSEITEVLNQGQKSHDRHDIVARVFHVKVKHMMKLLMVGRIFGNTQCYMYTIEWQKRGLPHVHILLWLEEKIKPDCIDQVISAELPDPDLDPALFEIIKSTMIHGPCGLFNVSSPCMVDGKCTKRYPRVFLKQTETGEDGYPQYRRRSPADGGRSIQVNGVEIDNRWVVPYNSILSRTFKAHINVEYCNSVKSIKYICKYVNKGSDQAAFTVEDLDEVSQYQAGRYISSSEAVWRIFRFPIHDRFPSVIHLAVHLENGQRIYFTEDNVINKIDNPQKTTLMAFFELCQRDDFAKTLLYVEVPAYYTWKNNQFLRRKQRKDVPGYIGVKKDHALGRVYTVHPGNSECYYLRLLLHEVRGPTSFSILKTVEGVLYPTFQAACRALGLLEDDAHWDRTLEEACISDSPKKIRELFAIMLAFCQVSDPLILWDKYRDNFSEDIRRDFERKLGNVEHILDIIYNQGLILLEDIVMSMSGKILSAFGLQSPSREERSIITNHQYLRELAYDENNLSKIVAENVPKLNQEQKAVYNKILNAINSDSEQLYFLDAPGGTGKTFLINLLLARIRSLKNIAIAVASSGIAATLIDGGRTAHSTFKLPLNLCYSESPLCNISKQSDMARVLREATIIIWDECTMAHKKGIEALDRTLKDIRDCNRLMGGVIVLLAGDFRQTLPVIQRGTRADEVKACLKSSFLWPLVKVLSLSINMRVHLQSNSKIEEFSKILIDIGDGKIPEEEGKINISNILCDTVSDLITLTERIYPDIDKAGVHCSSWLKERAILTPTNEQANCVNNFLLEKLPTAQVKHQSVDQVIEAENAVHYPVEFLHTLNPPGIPPHILYLKIGSPIMLIRNLNPPKLCNGTRLMVKALHKNIIEATIFTGKYEGEDVFIPRIPLIPSDYPLEFKRLQFPIKICYAMTINKAQGQSLKIVGVDLRGDCFSHGQLYVACSRVSSPDSLIILQPTKKIKNVVYKEVLSL